MNGLLSIELSRLRFFSRHGLYAEEVKTGNEFEVSLSASYVPDTTVVSNIEDTVNYVSLYELVTTAMQEPTPLLETVAMIITEKIHHQFPFVKKITISIRKLYPPIVQFTGEVGVTYTKEF
jgi:7,8-dihydroneopterin aldolase/epimerase/oxygenase